MTCILILTTLILASLFCVWLNHIIESYSRPFGEEVYFGNFKYFKREFKKKKWRYNGYQSALVPKNSKKYDLINRVGYTEFRFDSVYMALWPISYFRSVLYVFKQKKKKKPNKKSDYWKNKNKK